MKPQKSSQNILSSSQDSRLPKPKFTGIEKSRKDIKKGARSSTDRESMNNSMIRSRHHYNMLFLSKLKPDILEFRSMVKMKSESQHQPQANALPNRSLELEYVYAFKGKDSRANILCLREQEAITFVGPLGIVHCLASNSQVARPCASPCGLGVDTARRRSASSAGTMRRSSASQVPSRAALVSCVASAAAGVGRGGRRPLRRDSGAASRSHATAVRFPHRK